MSETYSVFDAGPPNNTEPIPTTTSSNTFYAKMVDVNFYNASIDISGLFRSEPLFPDSIAILFTIDQNGFPILTPLDTFNLDPNLATNLMGRFRALNVTDRYVSIHQSGAATTFAVGDPIYLDPADGPK